MLPMIIAQMKTVAHGMENFDSEIVIFRYRTLCELCCVCYKSSHTSPEEGMANVNLSLISPMRSELTMDESEQDTTMLMPWLSQSHVRCAIHKLLVTYIAVLEKTYLHDKDISSMHTIGNFRVCTELFECLLHSIATCYQYTSHIQGQATANTTTMTSTVYNELCDAKDLLHEYSLIATRFVSSSIAQFETMNNNNLASDITTDVNVQQDARSVQVYNIVVELSVLAEKYFCYKTLLETLLFLEKKEKLYHLMRIVGGSSSSSTNNADIERNIDIVEVHNEHVSFADFVIKSMLDVSTSKNTYTGHTFVMDLPSEFDDTVYRHICSRLKGDSDSRFLNLKWMHEVKRGEYAAAAESFNQLAIARTSETTDIEGQNIATRLGCLQKIATKIVAMSTSS